MDVDYYARVHFAGLVGVIDALGGIDVNSDVAFNTVGMEVPDEDGSGNFHFAAYSFQQGLNHLDGRQALAFAGSGTPLTTAICSGAATRCW